MTNAQGNRGWATVTVTAILLMLTAAIAASAQTFTLLHSFDYTDGENPAYGALVQATDGNLYGTTSYAGPYLGGTVFKISPSGTLTTIYNFCSQGGNSCTDGAYPDQGLVQATNGYLYGMATEGGAYTNGTIFKINESGSLTTVYNFCPNSGCAGGSYPGPGLTLADGNFYGTTVSGGTGGVGAVFRLTPTGSLTTLYSFCLLTNCIDGSRPAQAPLAAGSNGDFYGTTVVGGSGSCDGGCGTVFKITAAGTLTQLRSFNITDGAYPTGGLIQATDGNFYGTTNQGGTISYCTDSQGCGTVFKISPNGTLTTLYSFCSKSNCNDGSLPIAGLVQGTDGNLYGTTEVGGTSGSGTIFEITPSGTLTTLHSFAGYPTDGAEPFGGLVQATNGGIYGTTLIGGTNVNCGGSGGCGTVFGLSVGLGAFVETVPTSGRVANTVIILGTNLKGATSVTFNGTAATLTVSKSGTYIKTTVPTGATTGPVQVVTPSGTLTSNVNFRVQP
jgi:uncharacterized repeat protein (TIGR03803 family)